MSGERSAETVFHSMYLFGRGSDFSSLSNPLFWVDSVKAKLWNSKAGKGDGLHLRTIQRKVETVSLAYPIILHATPMSYSSTARKGRLGNPEPEV